MNLSLKEKHDYIVCSKFIQGDEVISENSVNFVYDKHLNLKRPNISFELENIKDNEYSLILNTDKVAKFVEIELKELDVKFDDNYFNLFPNNPKIVKFNSDKKVSIDDVMIKSLVDSF